MPIEITLGSQNGIQPKDGLYTRPTPHLLIANTTSTYYLDNTYLRVINTAPYPKDVPVEFYCINVNNGTTSTISLGTATFYGATATLLTSELGTGTNTIYATWPGESRYEGFTTTMTNTIFVDEIRIYAGTLLLGTTTPRLATGINTATFIVTATLNVLNSGTITLKEVFYDGGFYEDFWNTQYVDQDGHDGYHGLTSNNSVNPSSLSLASSYTFTVNKIFASTSFIVGDWIAAVSTSSHQWIHGCITSYTGTNLTIGPNTQYSSTYISPGKWTNTYTTANDWKFVKGHIGVPEQFRHEFDKVDKNWHYTKIVGKNIQPYFNSGNTYWMQIDPSKGGFSVSSNYVESAFTLSTLSKSATHF